ncbi:MAG TPA: hypothetical protein VK982_11390, partial [Bacteroidales bacterium]|nr:hypothetical protein [Bacteroidales bacterium]
TPPMKNSNNLTYLSINDQYKKYYDMAKSLPHNHYCRKNIGYLFAINSGADIIFDTDDDNITNENWKLPKFEGFTTLIVDEGLKTSKIENIGRGVTSNDTKLWDDRFTASDPRAKYKK